MSIDIEDLGSCVFEELAFDYLAYNPFLSEARVVDHYNVDRETHRVVLSVNGIWYHLKTEKDSFSTLVQGSGAYLLDLWLGYIFFLRQKPEYHIEGGVRLVAQAHDENLQEFDDMPENEVMVKKLFDDALAMANKRLAQEIPFGCDTQTGYKYSEIH